MKKVFVFAVALALAASFTSCATVHSVKNQETEVAGYTLKNKKEIVEQKILHKKSKTVIVIP